MKALGYFRPHELRVGDALIGKDGRLRAVLRIEQEFKSAFRVNNLTIEDDHTFAVGADELLVHNVAFCDLFPNGLHGATQEKVLYRDPITQADEQYSLDLELSDGFSAHISFGTAQTDRRIADAVKSGDDWLYRESDTGRIIDFRHPFE